MVDYINYKIFDKYPEITAAFSIRKGGVSEGIFESLNLSLNSKDNPENIQENFRRYAEALGTSTSCFVASAQTHTTNIEIVNSSDKGNGFTKANRFHDVDGLITDCKDVFLCLFFADCVPVYIYDPVKKVIALVHSGWKGTVGKISAKAISIMVNNFGTDPSNVIAAIGPSICSNCYEVSPDLYFAFEKEFKEEQMLQIFKTGRLVVDENGNKEQKYQLSLWKAIELVLLEAGLSKENIFNPQICTFENHDLFFSHRYTQGKRGNNAAIFGMKNLK